MENRRFMTIPEAVVLAFVVLLLVIWAVFPRMRGASVTVERGGEVLGRYALLEPNRVPIQGVNGFSLVLVVEDGQAWVEESTCPDLICQRHAPISRAGAAIICLPARISVTVEGRDLYGPDAISG